MNDNFNAQRQQVIQAGQGPGAGLRPDPEGNRVPREPPAQACEPSPVPLQQGVGNYQSA